MTDEIGSALQSAREQALSARHRAMSASGLPFDGPGDERLSFVGVMAWLILARRSGRPLSDMALAIRTVVALEAAGARPTQWDAYDIGLRFDEALTFVLPELDGHPDAAAQTSESGAHFKRLLDVLACPQTEQAARRLDVLADLLLDVARLADLLDGLARSRMLQSRGNRLHELADQLADLPIGGS